jgi:hypothetical protein
VSFFPPVDASLPGMVPGLLDEEHPVPKANGLTAAIKTIPTHFLDDMTCLPAAGSKELAQPSTASHRTRE